MAAALALEHLHIPEIITQFAAVELLLEHWPRSLSFHAADRKVCLDWQGSKESSQSLRSASALNAADELSQLVSITP